jgi:hypothetical protein
MLVLLALVGIIPMCAKETPTITVVRLELEGLRLNRFGLSESTPSVEVKRDDALETLKYWCARNGDTVFRVVRIGESVSSERLEERPIPLLRRNGSGGYDVTGFKYVEVGLKRGFAFTKADAVKILVASSRCQSSREVVAGDVRFSADVVEAKECKTKWTTSPKTVFVTGGEFKGRTIVTFCFTGEVRDYGREVVAGKSNHGSSVVEQLELKVGGERSCPMTVLSWNGLY